MGRGERGRSSGTGGAESADEGIPTKKPLTVVRTKVRYESAGGYSMVLTHCTRT